MNETVATGARTAKTASPLKRAAIRSSGRSREGLLERLFAFAFDGLVYPRIWEDPAVDMAAMELEAHHHVVAIASGGCNVMSYLTASPARITAVDLNLAHLSLLELKLKAARHLPSHQDFTRFFARGFYRHGLIGRCIWLAHTAARPWTAPGSWWETGRNWPASGRAIRTLSSPAT